MPQTPLLHPPSDWVLDQGRVAADFYIRTAEAGNQLSALVAASGHNETDVQNILINLDRLGWKLVRKE